MPSSTVILPSPIRGGQAGWFAKLNRLDGVDWRWHAVIFLICAAAVASRRISLLNHPAFYAEDGAVWYLDAYSFGWLRPLLSPSGGYLNTWPRLVAAVAQLVPFGVAPLFMNLVGIVVQVLPVHGLLHRRSSVWGGFPVRLALAFVYMVLPNVAEIHVVLTNSHFHLAVLAFLLIVAVPPASAWGAALDAVVLTLSGLSDPFCFPLVLIAGAVWSVRRTRWSLLVVGIEALLSLIQALELALGAGRPVPHLGASLHRFLLILGGQVYAGALLGAGAGPRLPYWLVVALCLICTALLGYCLVKAPLVWKLFTTFAFMLFFSGILRPLASGPGSIWVGLALGAGPRYWFFPMLAFAWCLVWCAMESRRSLPKLLGRALLGVMIIGAVKDWRLPAFPPVQFRQSAHLLAAAREGDLLTVPTWPEGWSVRFRKKGPVCQYPPISGLDGPPQPANVETTMLVGGWLASAERVKDIEVFIDGKLMQTAALTNKRPEIDALWPWAENKLKGWSALVATGSLAPGPHTVVVRAWEQGGCRAELETFPVTRIAGKTAR